MGSANIDQFTDQVNSPSYVRTEAEVDALLNDAEDERIVEQPRGNKKLKPKPDLGFVPKNIWLERRIKRICKAIADASDVHKDWENELLELMCLERADRRDRADGSSSPHQCSQ